MREIKAEICLNCIPHKFKLKLIQEPTYGNDYYLFQCDSCKHIWIYYEEELIEDLK